MDTVRQGFEHSQETQDIIGHNPTWMLKGGIMISFLLLVVILAIGWFIRYPNVVTFSILLTTDPGPVFLSSRTPGRLTFLKTDNEYVNKGEVIAHIQTTTTPGVVSRIEKVMEDYSKTKNLESFYLELSQVDIAGDLQNGVNETLKSILALMNHNSISLYSKQAEHLRNQRELLKRINTDLSSQLRLQNEEVSISKKIFEADSILFIQNVLSLEKYNHSKNSFLRVKRDFKRTNSSIFSNKLQIETREKQIMELKAEKSQKDNVLYFAVSDNVSKLKSEIKRWKETYLITAPSNGKLIYTDFWENNQINEMNTLFGILPDSTLLIAQGKLPVDGTDKINVGQAVKILLDKYPEYEYGVFKGVISEISEIPIDGNYKVRIKLTEGLKTSYDIFVGHQSQLKGEAHIVTDNTRLLNKFIKSLLRS